MTTLYVDRKDVELRYANGVVEVHEASGRRGSIPLVGLERVVLHGRVRLSTSVIGAFVKSGASVCLLGGRGSRYVATCLGQPHNDVYRRLGQFDAYRDAQARTRWSRELVAAKIASQLRVLRRAMADRPDKRHPLFRGIRRLEEALGRVSSSTGHLSVPTLRGMEGAAAAAYFAAFVVLFPPSLGFKARRRRPPPDPVNVCLSFGYTLLHYEAASAAQAAGLDPMLGLYHEPAYGRESLAADAIEPFRAHVDRWVLELFRRRILADRSFTRHGDTVLLGKDGRRRFYEHYNPLAKALRRLLRQQVQRAARNFEQRGRKLGRTS